MNAKPNVLPVALGPRDGKWLAWQGGPIRYLATQDDTNGKYCFSWARVPKGAGSAPHSHSFEEGFYVVSGEFDFRCGCDLVRLSAGEFAHIHAFATHGLTCVSEGGGELVVIAAPAGFDQFQMELGTELSDPDGPVPVTKLLINPATDAIAEKYGIQLHPDHESLSIRGDMVVVRAANGSVIDTVGDRYRFLADSTLTAGTYSIWHATVPAGGGPPPHIHRYEEEGFFILSGEVTFYSEDLKVTLGRGSYVQAKKNSLHWFRNESDHQATMLVLVAPGGLERMFQHTGTAVSDVSSPIAHPTRQQLDILTEIAPRFGIELRIPGNH